VLIEDCSAHIQPPSIHPSERLDLAALPAVDQPSRTVSLITLHPAAYGPLINAELGRLRLIARHHRDSQIIGWPRFVWGRKIGATGPVAAEDLTNMGGPLSERVMLALGERCEFRADGWHGHRPGTDA
jgi:hypothetical protein